MTKEQTQQFSDILDELGSSLDITKPQYDDAVTSYQAVGRLLSKDGSALQPYKPEIQPQGSFLIGTMTKPIHEDDDLDIDLVCQLHGKRDYWTQADVKAAIGDQLKSDLTYAKMLRNPDGRRCWTLDYAESARFHLDILPSIVSSGYAVLLEKSFSATESGYDSLSMRITDKLHPLYKTATEPENWLLSNPFGYGKWFIDRATISLSKTFSLLESIQPVPTYRKEKLPLQRIVQILKRHRDIMFNGDENKPISIIITTLAALAYNHESDIIQGLLNVVHHLVKDTFVEMRYDANYGRYIKWVANPVNPAENFADKWPETPKKQENYYKWVTQLQSDLQSILGATGSMSRIEEQMSKSFGAREVAKAFSSYSDGSRRRREQGLEFMAGSTGMIGGSGSIKVSNHDFFGSGR